MPNTRGKMGRSHKARISSRLKELHKRKQTSAKVVTPSANQKSVIKSESVAKGRRNAPPSEGTKKKVTKKAKACSTVKDASKKKQSSAKVVTPTFDQRPVIKSENEPKKKINMNDGVNFRGGVIDLTLVNDFLKKKQAKEVHVIKDKNHPNGKLTLKVYKSEVIQVGHKQKFCVAVDLVNSKTNKSLWCNDGGVMANVFESMASNYNLDELKNASPIDMRDEPCSETIRGKKANNGVFYPFKIAVFSVTVDESFDSAESVFQKLASSIMKVYCSHNFQQLFFMIKRAMPSGLPMTFQKKLEDSFKDGRDFALLTEDSFTMEQYENIKLIDLIPETALDNIIIPSLFYDELQAFKNCEMEEDEIKDEIKKFGR